MTDPLRLSRSPAHSLAATLLRAGAQEKPSAAVFDRATAAVAMAVVAATSVKVSGSVVALGSKQAASAAAASSLAGGTSAVAVGGGALSAAMIGIGAVAKWIAIGALGGAAALSSVQALIAGQGPKRAQALPAAADHALSAGPGRRSAVVIPTPTLVASTDPKEPERPEAVEAQRVQSRDVPLGDLTKAEAAAPGRPEAGLLAAEVRFVDQGRAALQRSAFAEALEQLTPYEQLFPHQQLVTEVLFLRMEALSQLGNRERARTLATRILALGVAGRQAAQAREVLSH